MKRKLVKPEVVWVKCPKPEDFGGFIGTVLNDSSEPTYCHQFPSQDKEAEFNTAWDAYQEWRNTIQEPWHGYVCKVMELLYASGINVKIQSFWDGGFDVALGDEMNGYVAQDSATTFPMAVEMLRRMAEHHYPDSVFAKQLPTLEFL